VAYFSLFIFFIKLFLVGLLIVALWFLLASCLA